jgi:hypothetical protein
MSSGGILDKMKERGFRIGGGIGGFGNLRRPGQDSYIPEKSSAVYDPMRKRRELEEELARLPKPRIAKPISSKDPGLAANVRSAIFDNIQTRPRLSAPYELSNDGGIPAFREPLERSVKPLPTLPPIVGNTRYDPMRFKNAYETPGTTFLRDRMTRKRDVLPEMGSGSAEPSNSNPTVL